MDISQVVHALQHTYNPNEVERSQAEQALSRFERAPGFYAALLELTTKNEVHVHIRQAAVIRLKNLCKLWWSVMEGADMRVHPGDRKVIHENLVEAIVFQHEAVIRTQLLELFKVLVRYDFPDRWPSLLQQITNNLSASDNGRVYGGLCALHKLMQRFQYASGAKRRMGDAVADQMLPMVMKHFQVLVQHATLESFEMLRIVVKIWFVSTQTTLPPSTQSEAGISPWLHGLMAVMALEVPADQAPQATAQLFKHPLWKAKKWASFALQRMFARFGRPAYVEEHLMSFAEMFYNTFSARLLQLFMSVLDARNKGQPIHPRVMLQTFTFLHASLDFAGLYQMMRPHLHFIIFDSIMPTLALSDEDLHVWVHDPQEFLRRSLDILAEFNDPRMAATNLLYDLVRVRTGDTRELVLTSIQKLLETYAAAAQQGTPDNNMLRLKEVAMRMLGSLNRLLVEKEEFERPVASLLVAHVFPEFGSQVGFLRSRACWLVGKYSKLSAWETPEHHSKSVELVAQCMNDRELVVRMEAAFAMARLVDNPIVVPFIRPLVPKLLEQFFTLWEDVGNQEVLVTMTTLVQSVGSEIAPYAILMTTKLSHIFTELFKAPPDDDEAALSAMQCLHCIQTVIEAVVSVPNIYPALETILQPLLAVLLRNDEGIEFFESALEFITGFTYFPQQISPFMWSLLPRILQCYSSFAADYISYMIPAIDNYISRGQEVMVKCQDPPYLNMVIGLCKMIVGDNNRQVDAQYACKILETVLAHLRFRVDHLVPAIAEMTVHMIGQPTTPIPLLKMSLDVLGGLFYYNPVLTVEVLARSGTLKPVLGRWIDMLPNIGQSFKHQKMAVLGLASIALIPSKQLPPEVGNNLAAIILNTVEVLKMHHTLQTKLDQLESDDEATETDDFQFKAADEDTFTAEDVEAYNNILDEAMTQRESTFGFEEAEEIEEDNFESPLDDVDPFVFFVECLQQLEAREPQWYVNWRQSLQPQQLGDMESVFNIAQVRVQQIQHKKAEKEREMAERAQEIQMRAQRKQELMQQVQSQLSQFQG